MPPIIALTQTRPTGHGLFPSSEDLVGCDQGLTVMHNYADEGLVSGHGELGRYSDEDSSGDKRWNRRKATLLQLYMIENRPLRAVRAFMHAHHGFQASEKMYKDRFARWGWKKNQSKSGDVQPKSFPGQNARTRRWTLDAPRGLRSPDTSRSLEVAIFETRRLIEAHIGPDTWRNTTFTLSPAPQLLGQLPDLYTPDIYMLYAIHQMRQQDVVPAFTAIGQIFAALPMTIHTQHLKSVPGLWLLYRKVLDICMMVGDSDVQLLRMMMLFQAQFSLTPHQARFSAFGCFTKLLSSLARMNRRSPELLDEIFRQGYTAVARTFEEQLGPSHPSVLQAWGNLAWYWSLSEAAMQHMIATYTDVLQRAEAAYGPTHTICVCMLCDFAILVHHSGQQPELGLSLAEDLWERVQASALTKPPDSGSPMLRVAAMGAVLRARTIQLENHESTAIAIQEICDPVLSWLETSHAEDVTMVAVMLQADQALMLEACTAAGTEGVDDKQFNFLRPRCFDIEREEN